MRWARVQVRLGVIVWSLVFVMYDEADRGAEGYIVLGAGLEVDLVELGALRPLSHDVLRTEDMMSAPQWLCHSVLAADETVGSGYPLL